jgi:LSD1 subclass zinc finger protein
MRRKIKKFNGDLKKTLTTKVIQCSSCERMVSVDEDITSVKCWYCSTIKCPGPIIKQRMDAAPDEPKKPKGWHFMAVFVDSDGNVFHKGVEQPKLKGTLAGTVIKPKKTRAQKDADKAKKEEKKDAKLVKMYKKKQELKKATQDVGPSPPTTEGTI